MKTISIQSPFGDCLVCPGAPFETLEGLAPLKDAVIITDDRVWELYRDIFPPAPVIRIGRGEAAKTLETVRDVYDALKRLGAGRHSFIVGVGGGIVCDIAGFAASTYLRGLGFGLAPTTLLAQVDAAIGGKNGVNFEGYKNLVGVFRQPGFVISDPAFLKTLPPEEMACGMAEAVKHAAIMDPAHFSFIETHCDDITALDMDALKTLVRDSAAIKTAIVNRDPGEGHERKKLNFGHTFGHALEKTLEISHGRAVAMGMALAAALSVEKGLLAPNARDRLLALLNRLKLPSNPVIEAGINNKQAVLDAIGKDKKRTRHAIDFVLLKDIGRAEIRPVSLGELEAFLDRAAASPSSGP
ncbi:3-dehydroquinate synthase [Candidatus Desulfarcum epimagneticum]|uniref:3-dehydroquinate synthase n=1 Tax=uncultured Desulfobacteraceae bacterium TaxID=218296 RepID=A0A484HC66_9BACT|nr:3-dehydroquinate synthase [uncultured Desulfobacteraceae bacterium]